MPPKKQEDHCLECGCMKFYKKDGYYFCEFCNTQNNNIREEYVETQFDRTIVYRISKIRTPGIKQAEDLGWTSWELYNAVLIGLADELIQLGASPEIKLTILQLWATYLGKLEVAFTSTKRKTMPKLSLGYWQKDVDILYGKIKKRKKKRQKTSSITSASSAVSSSYQSESSVSKRSYTLQSSKVGQILSQASSEGDSVSLMNQSLDSIESSTSKSSKRKLQLNKAGRIEAKKVYTLAKKLPLKKRPIFRERCVSDAYKCSPQMISRHKLWALVYLAVRIHDEKIHVSDMLRFAREGHLSYYKMDHLIPPGAPLHKTDLTILTGRIELSHVSFRHAALVMAQFLEVHQLAAANLNQLVEQYCLDLQLPHGVMLYAQRLITLSQPKMNFTLKMSHIPNYEGRAMAFIIVVLKLLFGLDGVTEYKISRVAERINRLSAEKNILDSTLFSFCEWQRYIECRRNFLAAVHFPTQIKLNLDGPENNRLFSKFFQFMESKREGEEPITTKNTNMLPKVLYDSFKRSIERLNENAQTMQDADIFEPSLTPQHTYIQQLLENPLYDLPCILRINFVETKVGYMRKPQKLKDLAAQCDFHLDIVDSSLHFVEKLVTKFENVRFLKLDIFKEIEEVKGCGGRHDSNSEILMEYLHKQEPATIEIDKAKYHHYNASKILPELDAEDDDFVFHNISQNGKLQIPCNSDEESDDEDDHASVESASVHSQLLLEDKFCQQYNLYLSESEKCCVTTIDRTKINLKEFLGKDKNVECLNEVASKNRPESKRLESLSETQLDEEENRADNVNVIDENKKMMKEDEEACQSKNKFDFPDSSGSCDTLFRPYKDYWMYDCKFAKVAPKNFKQFEKELPYSFNWLMRECANALEMNPVQLYEEVCVVENYFAYILTPENDSKDPEDKPMLEAMRKIIREKW